MKKLLKFIFVYVILGPITIPVYLIGWVYGWLDGASSKRK